MQCLTGLSVILCRLPSVSHFGVQCKRLKIEPPDLSVGENSFNFRFKKADDATKKALQSAPGSGFLEVGEDTGFSARRTTSSVPNYAFPEDFC